MQTGDIIQSNAIGVPFFRHHGVLIDGNVYHNTPGRGVVSEPLSVFLSGRRVLAVTASSVPADQLLSRIREVQGIPFNFLSFNCEHFITYLTEGRAYSPQLAVSIVVVFLVFALQP